MERLILWDIDRTLITMAGSSVGYFERAFTATTGLALEILPEFGGRTDRAIISGVLELHGVPVTEEAIEAVFTAMTAAALESEAEMLAVGSALPGAAAALAALATLPAWQTVVTGNIASLARQKLTLFELVHHIDLEVGGYGSESTDRADIVRSAWERAAAKYGRAIPGEAVVVVGDTPHDIAGARDNGVNAVGVATGHSSVEELWAAGAHAVLPSLADTAAVVAAVTGRRP
ncbi:MAG TPA: HAD hydrolase-like protein [Candidatus Limnocylindrales bacterium]